MSKAMEDLWKQGVNEGIKQAIEQGNEGIKQAIEQGVKEGLEQGIRIGEERVAKRAALHLLLNKKHRYTIDEIAYISGLLVENVKKLKAENSLN